MEKELGENKATAWIASGKLPTRADPVTHNTTKYEIEYAVPTEWQAITMADLESWTLRVQSEADEEDLGLMDIMRKCNASTEFGTLAGGQASSSNAVGGDGAPMHPDPVVKIEKDVQIKQERQELAKHVLMFHASKEDKLRRVQAQIIQVAKISAAAQLDEQVKKYSGPVIADMESHKTRLNKAATMLKKCICEPSTVIAHGVPKLLAGLEEMNTAHDVLISWARKFGLEEKPEVDKKRRRK